MVRSGDEPTTARSPLRLRLALALLGAVTALTGVALGVLTGSGFLVVGAGLVLVVAVLDAVLVAHRIRQGPHFQPGPTVPPYRVPASPDDRARRPRLPTTDRGRQRTYLVLMGTCLLLVTVSWVWLRTVSTTAAVAVGAVAMGIPPVAAILANAGWRPPDDGPSPPGGDRPGTSGERRRT